MQFWLSETTTTKDDDGQQSSEFHPNNQIDSLLEWTQTI
jgi:nitrous oxidase accessory protein NosD